MIHRKNLNVKIELQSYIMFFNHRDLNFPEIVFAAFKMDARAHKNTKHSHYGYENHPISFKVSITYSSFLNKAQKYVNSNQGNCDEESNN
jgi:hypothetical protein